MVTSRLQPIPPWCRSRIFKDKGLVAPGNKNYGHTLITQLLGLDAKRKSVRLRVPLGEDLQAEAEKYFLGVFGYYRNYVAHRDSNIDKVISARVMVIASELLDLVDASHLNIADIGGVEGLLAIGEFASRQQLRDVLERLTGQWLPNGATDGLLEAGFNPNSSLGERSECCLTSLSIKSSL